jgi:hypothetical protein
VRRIDQPEPGYYKMRLRRGGPWVGVRIAFDQSGDPRAEVDGRSDWPDGSPIDAFAIWPYVRVSDQGEFEFLARWREWALAHAPEHPAARPFEPIDYSKLPPRF